MKDKENLIKQLEDYLGEEFGVSEGDLLIEFLRSKIISISEINEFYSDDRKKALDILIDKGVITYLASDRCYQLKSVEELCDRLQIQTASRLQSIESRTRNFVDFIRTSFNRMPNIKVDFYEGIEGVKQSYYHILEHAEGEICAYYSVLETQQEELQKFLRDVYAPARSRKKIFSRNLAPKTPKTIYYKLMEQELYSETRLISPQYFPLFNAEINLYGDYMQSMVLDEHGGMAIILKAKDVVRLNKAMFEIAWGAANFPEFNVSTSIMVKTESSESQVMGFFPTDNIEQVLQRIDSRKDRFTSDLREKWVDAVPEYVENEDGEQILKICDLEVMSDFQKPFMKKLAQTATIHGGKILSVGYGLGLVDSYIESQRSTRDITEHHIIEINETVYQKALEWREAQSAKDQIFIHKGDWQDVLPNLVKQGYLFDGVVYDGYPLEISELCRDAVPFLYALLSFKLVKEKKGIVTFFLDSTDGIAKSFEQSLRSLGVNEIQLKKVEVDLPKRKHEHWNTPYFIVPLLTDIRYSEK